MTLKESDASLTASLKEVREKQEKELKQLKKESDKQFGDLRQEYSGRVIDKTLYENRENEYGNEHKRIRDEALGLMNGIMKNSIIFVAVVGIAALVLFVAQVGFALASNDNWDMSIYEIIPLIVAFALLVWSPMIWRAHVLFREAAKYHALREDAFTKRQIIILIDTGGYDKKTRYELIQRFITYHEMHSSAHIILNTKPPSIPQKSGLDSATNLKNWTKPKSK